MTSKGILSSGAHLLSLLRTALKGESSRADRFTILLFAAALTLFLLILPLSFMEKSSRKETDSLRTKLKELSALSAEYQSLKEHIDVLEQRKSLTKGGGIPQAVDEVTSSVGLKEKVRGVKAIGNKDIAGGTEETADVQIEKVTMNELINILYRIQNAPVMLSVRRIAIKKTFENPELLNFSVTLSLFVKK